MGDYLKLHERVGGSGPKRIIIYAESDNSNVGPELKGWILSTTPWDESDETVLVKIVDDRVTAVVDSECDKAVPKTETIRLMEDCRTLLEIKGALAYDIAIGDPLFNWTGDLPISKWNGITVENGRVRALEYILRISPRGTIPPQIADLTELRTLHIRHDELEGEIPPELGSLSKLETLYIGGFAAGWNRDVHVSGRIPPELGKLSNLRILDLQGNALTGDIPRELGKLSKLEILNLRDNKLSGEIPRELGKLSNLKELNLSGNDLEGEIPPELGNLTNLSALLLDGNRLE